MLDEQQSSKGQRQARPQFTMGILLSVFVVVGVGLASVRYLGIYSIGVMPGCLTLLCCLCAGLTWRESIHMAAFVYFLTCVALLALFVLILAVEGLFFILELMRQLVVMNSPDAEVLIAITSDI